MKLSNLFIGLIIIIVPASFILIGLAFAQFLDINGTFLPDKTYNNESLRISREAFAMFGDFFGGVVNPFLSFITVLLLLITIKQGQDNLSLTEQQKSDSNSALSQTIDEMRKQRLEDIFQRHLDMIKVKRDFYLAEYDLLKERPDYESVPSYIVNNHVNNEIGDQVLYDKYKSFSLYVASVYQTLIFIDGKDLDDYISILLFSEVGDELIGIACFLHEAGIRITGPNGGESIFNEVVEFLAAKYPKK